MMILGRLCGVSGALLMLAAATPLRAGERVVLRSGFEMECVRHESRGDRMRCYSRGEGAEMNYVDFALNSVARVDVLPDTPVEAEVVPKPIAAVPDSSAQPTPAELKEMLSNAGAQHNVDAELLASVVHAESGGRVQAVSRTGARGLMQLMPGTASSLGVKDSFMAKQNVEGGTKYLDALLTRYHDNMALALAAYNAGPGAVDKYGGVPPYRETRAYVARVIREFNRRKMTLPAQAK